MKEPVSSSSVDKIALLMSSGQTLDSKAHSLALPLPSLPVNYTGLWQ